MFAFRVPDCLVWMIAEYAAEYVLLDWVRQDRLVLYGMARNPHPRAVEMVLSELTSIADPEYRELLISILSGNPSEDAMRVALASGNEKYIDWYRLSANPHPLAVDYVLRRENHQNIDWSGLSENPHPRAVKFLLDNPHKMCWIHFSKNSHPAAVVMLKDNANKIDHSYLSANPSDLAFDLLMDISRTKPAAISFTSMSVNSNQRALKYLIDRSRSETKAGRKSSIINWMLLSENRNVGAMEVLCDNIAYVDWWSLSANPNIFRATTCELYDILTR